MTTDLPDSLVALQPSTVMNKQRPLGTLFIKDGQPITFSIQVQKDQVKLAKLIQKYGGEIGEDTPDITVIDSHLEGDTCVTCSADDIIQCVKEHNLRLLEKCWSNPLPDPSPLPDPPTANPPDSVTCIEEEEALLNEVQNKPFAAQLFVHSSSLEPMTFKVARGIPERQRILELIERHGGKIHEGAKVDYRIVDPLTSSDPTTLSYQFILDSAAYGCLKDTSPYLTGNLAPLKKRSFKMPFTHEEDVILIDFYLQNGESTYIKKFEELARLHPQHPAESWKNRFMKMKDREVLIQQRRAVLPPMKSQPLSPIYSLTTPLALSLPSQPPAVEPIALASTPSVIPRPGPSHHPGTISLQVLPAQESHVPQSKGSNQEEEEADSTVEVEKEDVASRQDRSTPEPQGFHLSFEDVAQEEASNIAWDAVPFGLPQAVLSLPSQQGPSTPSQPLVQDSFNTPTSCVTPSIDRSILLSQSPTLTPVNTQKRKEVVSRQPVVSPIKDMSKRTKLSPIVSQSQEDSWDALIEKQLGLPNVAQDSVQKESQVTENHKRVTADESDRFKSIKPPSSQVTSAPAIIKKPKVVSASTSTLQDPPTETKKGSQQSKIPVSTLPIAKNVAIPPSQPKVPTVPHSTQTLPRPSKRTHPVQVYPNTVNSTNVETHIKAAKSVASLARSQKSAKSKTVSHPSPLSLADQLFTQPPDYGEDMLDPFAGVATLVKDSSTSTPARRRVSDTVSHSYQQKTPKQDIAKEIAQLIRDYPQLTKKEIIKAVDRVSGVPRRARKLIQANMERDAMNGVEQVYVFSKEEDVVVMGTDRALLQDLKKRKGPSVVAERLAYLRAKQACKRRSIT